MSEHTERLEDLKTVVDVLGELYPEADVSGMMIEEIPPREPEDEE